MKSIAVVMVILALVGIAVVATVRTILPPIEQSGTSGWVGTALLVASTAFAAYTIRLAYRDEPHARRA